MAEIERVDKYHISINGHKIVANAHQEVQIRNMSDEEVARFLIVMGKVSDH